MENDFELLERVIREIDEPNMKVPPKNNKNQKSHEELCSHENIITTEKNITTCVECGEELESVPFDKEWRFYGSNDGRFYSDPNRCQIRKSGERSIYKDIEGLGLSDTIVAVANDLYNQITDGDIHRGARRRGIIFACIRQSYLLSGKPQTFDDLITLFGLERKSGLKGVKYVNLKTPKEFKKNISHITHQDLLKKIMNTFGAKESQIQEVLNLYPEIQDKSEILNGSRPSSLAAGLIYYWICKNNKLVITSKEFADEVKLSELTIRKIYIEISRVLADGQKNKSVAPFDKI